MPAHGALAVVVVALVGATLLHRRRSRYVDTDPVRAAHSCVPGADQPTLGSRLIGRFGKLLNACVSAFLVLIVVIALMEIFAAGVPALARDAAAALVTAPRIPAVG